MTRHSSAGAVPDGGIGTAPVEIVEAEKQAALLVSSPVLPLFPVYELYEVFRVTAR
jgi:hypothetical protein